jgi:hypothetical protein
MSNCKPEHPRPAEWTWKQCPDCKEKGRRNAERWRERLGADEVSRRQNDYRRERRLRVINHYGGKCVCCGETTFEFLCMDHTYGGGTEHRKEVPGKSIIKWLEENGYPEDFQVLCHNCNQAQAFYDVCPHKRSTE